MEKEINKYDSLDDRQFSRALFASYENLYRLTGHENPKNYEQDKELVFSEIRLILQNAQKRFPEINDVWQKGHFYKDSDIANAERLLIPFMEKCAEKDVTLSEDFSRYKAWRDGKDFVTRLNDKEFHESPFQNTARWPSSMSSADQLWKPYEEGKRCMSEEQVMQQKLLVSKLNIR